MHRKPTSHLCYASALGVLLGLASPATAEGDSKTSQENVAKKACAMGDYQKGADILTDLFVATNNVTYVYNQARCYEQNNIWDRAIARFREYLRKAKHLTKNERAETEQHISECETALARATAPPTPGPPEPSPTATAPAVTAKVEPPPTAPTPPAESVASALPSAPVRSPGRGLRIAGVVCGVIGVAAIGAGAGFALKTQSISSNEQKNGPTQAQEDDRKKYETWGWVSYGVGAAALATGVVFYIVGWPSGESANVALLPSVSATGGGLLLGGKF